MARLPRLCLGGLPHLVGHALQRGQPLLAGLDSRQRYVDLLAEALRLHRVALHAYAVAPERVWLLATPQEADGLPLTMQRIAKLFSQQSNRVSGSRGTLWESRFRSCVLEPSAWLMPAMCLVERSLTLVPGEPGSSLAHHLGQWTDPLVTDPPEFWALGNTPFERDAAYRRLLEAHPTPAEQARLMASLQGGWPLGSDAFLQTLAQRVDRPVRPRAAGRPKLSGTN